MRRPTSRAGITSVSLKRRRSSARKDAGRSAICLSSNRHDRGNEQQTSGGARLAGRGAVSARGGSKAKSSTRSDKVQPKMIPKVSIGSSSFLRSRNLGRRASAFCPRPPLTHSHIRCSREGTGLSGQLKSVARLLPCSTDLSRTAFEKRAPLRPSGGRGRAPGASEMRHPTGARTRAPKGAGG